MSASVYMNGGAERRFQCWYRFKTWVCDVTMVIHNLKDSCMRKIIKVRDSVHGWKVGYIEQFLGQVFADDRCQ